MQPNLTRVGTSEVWTFGTWTLTGPGESGIPDTWTLTDSATGCEFSADMWDGTGSRLFGENTGCGAYTEVTVYCND